MPVERGPQPAGVSLDTGGSLADENARLYEEAQRQHRWLQASGEVTISLLSGTDPRQVLGAVTAQVRELSGADLVYVAIPENDGRRITISSAEGDGADGVRGLVLPADHSLSGQVLGTGKPVTALDFPADPRSAEAARARWGTSGRPRSSRSARRATSTGC